MHDSDVNTTQTPRRQGDLPPRVLIVEDSLSLAATYRTFLQNEPIELIEAYTGKEAQAVIETAPPDLILLDLHLPDISGMEILKRFHAQLTDTIVIVITGHGSANIAVEALKMGAYDFISKPVSASRLRTTVRNSLNYGQLQHVLEHVEQSLERTRFQGFLGKSLVMQAVYHMIETAAPSRAPVFITGESGTGKELCAQAIHDLSPRTAHPFIAINCAAIPHELMESELFGHVKGAFSGAVNTRRGAALRAHQGTLFLDEICEMNLDLQSKLLRFLQSQKIQPVGSDETLHVDVRIIAATNCNPYHEVQEKRFREDLFYRIHVLPIHIPPLRERGDDILMIATELLVQFSKEEGKHFVRFDSEVEAFFKTYAWPGNVRHLQNIIRSLVVMYDERTVTKAMLPESLLKETDAVYVTKKPEHQEAETIFPLAHVERQAIERALEYCEGNIQQAAGLLQVSPSTLYRKIQSWRSEEKN